MALTKNKGASGFGIPNLGNIGSALEVQKGKTTTRQAVEAQTLVQQQQITQRARKDALAINDQARAVNDETRAGQLDILSGMTSQLDKAREAMRLADSDNPLDRVSLWFLQQQDPGYTREGNLERLGYLQSAAGLIGDVGAIRQGEFADEIARTQEMLDMELAANDDRFEVVKLAETQGQELIDAEIQAQNTRLGVMQNQISMQDHALANTTDDQIILATQQAAKSPTQSTNIGGVEISLARLQERSRQVQELRYNESVMNLNIADMALANLDMPALVELEKQATSNKKRTAMLGDTPIPAGRISDRIYQLNNQELGMAQGQAALMQTQDTVIRRAQQNALDQMLMPQLEAIIQNGFKDPVTNIKYSSDMVRAARDQRANDVTISAQSQAMTQGMLNPETLAAQTQQQIDTILPNFAPGSPNIAALQTSRQGLAVAAGMLASGDAQQMEVGHRLIQAANENITNSINAEAKRLALGDTAKESAYQFVLRGQQIPAELIRGELMERVKKGEYVGSWLSPEQNATFVSTYNQTKFTLQSGNVNSGAMVEMSNEDIEAQAAEAAVNAVMNQIAAPMSDTIMMMQANKGAAPNNPITSVMTQTEFASIVRNADQAGIQAFIESGVPNPATGKAYTEQEQAQIRAGQLIPPELTQAQNAKLYMALESKKRGLGDAYGTWWSGEEPSKLVEIYTQSQLQGAAGDFTKMSQLSLVAPVMKDAMGNYGVTFEDGKRQVYADEIAREHTNYVTFGGNPQTKQVFMLEQTPGLTSQEKQIGMQQIIQPILATIAANGVTDPAQVTLQIESMLQSFEPQTSQGKQVLTKMLKGRDAAMKVVDDFGSANTNVARSILGAQLGNSGPMAGFNPLTGAEAAAQVLRANQDPFSTGSFSWFTDLGKSGQQQTTSPVNRQK